MGFREALVVEVVSMFGLVAVLLSVILSAGIAQCQEVPVAFSAEIGSEQLVYESFDVTFDRAIFNERGYYAPTSGQFACVDNGIYIFIWSLAKAAVSGYTGMRCNGNLKLGGNKVFHGPQTSYYGTTSVNGPSEVSSVQTCERQRAFKVGIEEWSSTSPQTWLAAPYTSFAGFKLANSSSDVVAFSAVMSRNSSYFDGTIIVYGEELVNYGGHFRPRYGAFFCPDNGLYVFSVAHSTPYLNSLSTWATSRLMYNGNVATNGPMTYRAASSFYNSGTASMTTVLQCEPGMDVYTEAAQSHTFVYNNYEENLSTFTGFRINTVDSPYGFTAVLNNNFTTGSSEPRIPFNRVVTNAGGAFDGSTGEFICPDNRVYAFTITAVSIQAVSPGRITLVG